ncbi:protein FAM177A1-like [Actinia tenebrosa]|uniref:Protein FAM177A1-like n=1 Tax=Actinia tenebrosa TaxID=6105 RepID=A0A6P8HT20_ACTTE|nr:protein FAM177A1-like [Actinia tenebrosa]
MATSSKVATDTQKKQSNKDRDSSSEEDDEDGLDLGTSSIPSVGMKSPNKEFEMINLDADEEDEEEDDLSQRSDDRRKKRYRKKKRKKEEISESSSEDESSKLTSKKDDINPSDLNWPLYFWYYIVAVSTGALRVAECLGEKLAYVFGITSPKYQYVIDEYYRLKEIEEEEEEREKREREYVEKKQAERIAQLEGGEKASEILTIPEEDVSNTAK